MKPQVFPKSYSFLSVLNFCSGSFPQNRFMAAPAESNDGDGKQKVQASAAPVVNFFGSQGCKVIKIKKASDKDKVTVAFQYCGGECGYEQKYEAARTLVEQKFGDKIIVEAEKDLGVTGNFKISVNGTLIHSKKTMQGHKFLDTEKDQQRVFDAIQKAIDEK